MKFLSVGVQKKFEKNMWFKYIFLSFNILYFYKIEAVKCVNICTAVNELIVQKNIDYRIIDSGKFVFGNSNKYFNFLKNNKYLLLFTNTFKTLVSNKLKLFAISYYGRFINNNYLNRINNNYLFYSNNYYFKISLCLFAYKILIHFVLIMALKALNIIDQLRIISNRNNNVFLY
jgi:hypothetical protein